MSVILFLIPFLSIVTVVLFFLIHSFKSARDSISDSIPVNIDGDSISDSIPVNSARDFIFNSIPVSSDCDSVSDSIPVSYT